jgi:alcohol dehydrogenase class IV
MVKNFKTAGMVFHGEGSISKITEILEAISSRKIGLIADPGLQSTGILTKIRELIQKEVEEFNKVEPEPSKELVEDIVKIFKPKGIDTIIAIGGGSAIDIGKMVATLLKNEGNVSDYLGVNKVPKAGVPLIVIPTTAGTGSEVSPAAVFHDKSDNTKKGVRSDYLYPTYVILDPELTYSLPSFLTASTGMDALTHAIEGLTSKNRTIISDLFARESISMIGENIRKAYASGRDPGSRRDMQMASYFAGITLAIANVGVVHALAQTIGGMYKISHGVANAFLLPHGMEFNLPACVQEYGLTASLLGVDTEGMSDLEAARSGIEAVRSLVQDLEIRRAPELKKLKGANPGEIANRCLKSQERLLVLNPRDITETGLEKIMAAALDDNLK